MDLYAHPFSSYCQKALIALYENDIPFDYRTLADAAAMAELAAIWPLKRFPVLVDGATTVVEATSIIEHLAVHHPGPARLIPVDPAAAVDVRMMDRVFDNYVSTPLQKIVGDAIRPAEQRDARGLADARELLQTAYAWLDRHLAGREWATPSGFSLADCAAAPALFYADWVEPVGDEHAHLRAYRARLLARPSVNRCVEEARPYRDLFPLGAPDRD